MEIVGSMIPAMDEVSRRFECEEFYVPEMLVSARIMKALLEPVRPLLAARGAEPAGRVVIGTVKGGPARYREEPASADAVVPTAVTCAFATPTLLAFAIRPATT